MKHYLFYLMTLLLFINHCEAQKYKNGTRLLKGAEVLSNTPLQLDYVLESLSDTANVTSLHEGKTHLILNDGSGEWREWWYIKGRWQPKALTTTSTDTLLIHHSTKDTLIIVNKDTLLYEAKNKIAGIDGSFICLKDSLPIAIPYLRLESTAAHIGQSSMLPMDIDFYLTIAKGLPMKMTCSYEGLYFNAGRGKGYANVEQHTKENEIYHRVWQSSSTYTKEGILSLSPDFTFLGGDKIQISANNKTELIIRDTTHINLNRNQFEPDHCYFRFENQQLKNPHPFSELYIDQSKLEFRKGKVSSYNSEATTTTFPPVFSAGNNFNYLDYLKYDTEKKIFYVKNQLTFIDIDNNVVGSIFVNSDKDDLLFTSKALGENTLSLYDIYNFINSPQLLPIPPDKDNSTNIQPNDKNSNIEIVVPTTTTTTTDVITRFIYGDILPDMQSNTLYLQLKSNRELWLHLQINNISKSIKLE